MFSTLDANIGYYQVPVNEDDRGETEFTNHAGIYQCGRMSLRLSTVPVTFQSPFDVFPFCSKL